MLPFDMLAQLELDPHHVSDDGQAEFWILGDFNGGNAWLGRYEGASPWTRHPDGDAFMHHIEGRVEVTLQRDDRLETHTVTAGQGYVIPRGTWFRHVAQGEVVQFGVFVGGVDHHEGEEPPADQSTG